MLKVKTVKADELEEVLNSFEPYKYELLEILPEVYHNMNDSVVTDYKLIYREISDGALRESE